MDTPPAFPLIPTRFKSKIAHTHSYPIGAEVISRALAGVPEFDRFELTFWDYKFQPLATSYEVLKIAYLKRGSLHSASREMLERRDFDSKWSIMIKPVSRGQRHAIQTHLLERRLPFARQWLIENATKRHEGRALLAYSWSEEQQVLGHEVERLLEPERI